MFLADFPFSPAHRVSRFQASTFNAVALNGRGILRWSKSCLWGLGQRADFILPLRLLGGETCLGFRVLV